MGWKHSVCLQLAMTVGATSAIAKPKATQADAGEPPDCASALVTMGHEDRQVIVQAADLCVDPEGFDVEVDHVIEPNGRQVPRRGPKSQARLRVDRDSLGGEFTIMVRDSWNLVPVPVNVVRDNAAPACPELTHVEPGTVALDGLGIIDADGDALTPAGVRLIGPGGELLDSQGYPALDYDVPDVAPYLDARGLAQAKLRVTMEDSFGARSTCTFPVDPPSGVVCGTFEQTLYDGRDPAILAPGDVCVDLDGDAERFRVTGVTDADGAPVAFQSTRDGAAIVQVEPGTTLLDVATTDPGDPVRFTIEMKDWFYTSGGSTDPVGETGGGTISVDSLVERIRELEADGSGASTGSSADPATPASAEPAAPTSQPAPAEPAQPAEEPASTDDAPADGPSTGSGGTPVEPVPEEPGPIAGGGEPADGGEPAEGGEPGEGGGDPDPSPPPPPRDPLRAVKVEIIGPDLSTLAVVDDPGAEIDLAGAPVAQQGLRTVTPRLAITVAADDGSTRTYAFDVGVNQTPDFRPDTPVEVDDTGDGVLPWSWFSDADGDDVAVLSIRDEAGNDVPFDVGDDGIQLRITPDTIGTGTFTITFRDEFRALRGITPNNIGTGTFTITSRDEFDAL